MAQRRVGYFCELGQQRAWFDPELRPVAWFDQDLLSDAGTPVVTINSSSASRLSSITGHTTDTVAFQADQDFQQWRAEQVATGGSAVFSGTLLTSGASGSAASTPVNASVLASELIGAGDGDGTYTVKVFVRNSNGNWST